MPTSMSAAAAILANQTNQQATANALLNPVEAALYLQIAEKTLAIWRCTGRYNIPYVKVGRCVRYRRSDLDAFIQRRMQGAEV